MPACSRSRRRQSRARSNSAAPSAATATPPRPVAPGILTFDLRTRGRQTGTHTVGPRSATWHPDHTCGSGKGSSGRPAASRRRGDVVGVVSALGWRERCRSSRPGCSRGVTVNGSRPPDHTRDQDQSRSPGTAQQSGISRTARPPPWHTVGYGIRDLATNCSFLSYIVLKVRAARTLACSLSDKFSSHRPTFTSVAIKIDRGTDGRL